MNDIWQMIEQGDFQRACDEADFQARKSPSLLPLRNKVIALLKLGRYREAEMLGRQLVEREPGQSARDYVFMGVSQWCEGSFSDAMISWEQATQAQYTDAAGGLRPLMLLLYGSSHNAGSKSQHDPAMRCIISHRRSKNWPGPLADYLSRRITESELLSQISGNTILRMRQRCQAEFYIGLTRQLEGNRAAMFTAMKNACNQGPSSYLEAEFHLACWECGQGY